MTINVLIFPAGEINSIELHDALYACVNVNVFGASSIERHGSYVFEHYFSGLPMIHDADFFEKFNKLLKDNHIDCIFPTHDTVAMFLADNAEKIKARLVCADKKTAEICRDKEKTYKVLSGAPFLPQVFDSIDHYPVFIKPREGQGAVGARLIRSDRDIGSENLSDYVICEYLPGVEYTVDCFTDREGRLRLVSPRSRDRLMAGVSVAGRTQPLTQEIEEIAEFINKKVRFLGLWWFQIKKDAAGKWKLLEISTRCAGTMALTRARGVNLPLLSVYTVMGYDVEVSPNAADIAMDSTLIRRYRINYEYDTVYFDFDDTLTLRGKVNLKAIWFLYQCQNQHKKVILLTKHEKELSDSMRHYHIDEGLFYRIVHIDPSDSKAKYIEPGRSIFIDNAYSERKAVAENCIIPVYDVDGLDALMDWRC